VRSISCFASLSVFSHFTMTRHLTLIALLVVAADVVSAAPFNEVLSGLDTAWPTPTLPADRIAATFGPRLKSSLYDWHRGVDIVGDVGHEVAATYAGMVDDIRFTASGGDQI